MADERSQRLSRWDNLYCFNGNNPLINKDLYGEKIDINQAFHWDMDDYYQEAYRHDYQYAWHPSNYFNNLEYSSSQETSYDMTESLFSNEGMSDLLRNTVDFIGNMHVGAYEGAFESFYKPFGYSVPGVQTQAGYYGRVVGRNTMTAIGIWQMGQGAFEIVMGLGGLGSSLGAEFVSLGGVSLLALPVAGASAGLIVSGAVKVGIGVALFKNSSNNSDKQYKETPINQIDKKIQRGKAPESLERAEHDYRPNTDHIHFKDGRTIYRNGKYKHGSNGKYLTNAEKKFLKENGFQLPNE